MVFLLISLSPAPPTHSGIPHNIFHVHEPCINMFFAYSKSLCCTLHTHDCSVNYQFVLLTPFTFFTHPLTPFPLATIETYFVAMIQLLFRLSVLFLDSFVGR